MIETQGAWAFWEFGLRGVAKMISGTWVGVGF